MLSTLHGVNMATISDYGVIAYQVIVFYERNGDTLPAYYTFSKQHAEDEATRLIECGFPVAIKEMFIRFDGINVHD